MGRSISNKYPQFLFYLGIVLTFPSFFKVDGSFNALNMLATAFGSIVSDEESAVDLNEYLLCVTNLFSLSLLSRFFFSWLLIVWYYWMCLGMGLLSSFFGVYWTSWTCRLMFHHICASIWPLHWMCLGLGLLSSFYLVFVELLGLIH